MAGQDAGGHLLGAGTFRKGGGGGRGIAGAEETGPRILRGQQRQGRKCGKTEQAKLYAWLLTGLADGAVAVLAVGRGHHGRGLEQDDLLRVAVLGDDDGIAHQAFGQGGRRLAAQDAVARHEGAVADHAAAQVGQRQMIDDELLVLDAFDEMLLVLDVAVGGDMPVVGGQHLFQHLRIGADDGIGVELDHVRLCRGGPQAEAQAEGAGGKGQQADA